MSTAAKALRWGGMLPFLLLATKGAPLTAIALPFALLPTSAALRWRSQLPPEKQANIDTLTYIYFGSCTIGLAGVLIAQGLLAYAFAFPIFGNETNRFMTEFTRTSLNQVSPETLQWRWTMSRSWKNYAFLTAMTYIIAGGVEELMKYLPIAYLRRRAAETRKPIAEEVYVQYAAAASLGFSTIENILYTKASVKAGERGAKLALTIFERVVAGGIGHTLTAWLIATNAAALGDYKTTLGSLWRILGVPILWHGTSDLILLAWSSVNGNIGWIHPEEPWQIVAGIAVVESIQLGLYLYTRRLWRALSG